MAKNDKISKLADKAERGVATRRELIKLAKLVGAEINPSGKKGTNHDNIVHEGRIYSQIPRGSKGVSRGVQQAVVDGLRLAGLLGFVLLVLAILLSTWRRLSHKGVDR